MGSSYNEDLLPNPSAASCQVPCLPSHWVNVPHHLLMPKWVAGETRVICLGSANTSSGVPCWLGLTPGPTSILILSLMLCLWSSCWPEVSFPDPTVGSSCIAIGDLVTLNSPAILPRNLQCFDQPKLRAAPCLTTLQELSLAKAQAGGSLPGRKILPQVSKVAINGSSYYASVNLSNLLPPSLFP